MRKCLELKLCWINKKNERAGSAGEQKAQEQENYGIYLN